MSFKPTYTNPFAPKFLANPLTDNLKTKPNEKSKSSDWEIDYSLAQKSVQYQKNIEFFQNVEDSNFNKNLIPDTNNNNDHNSSPVFENHINDDQDFFYPEQEIKEILISEQKFVGFENNVQDLNFDSKEILNLGDNDSQNSLFKEKEKTSESLRNPIVGETVIPSIMSKFRPDIEKNENQNLIDIDLQIKTKNNSEKINSEKIFFGNFARFNFNYGWTVFSNKSQNFSSINLNNKKKEIIDLFPGPLKLEKNLSYLNQNFQKIFEFLNFRLNNIKNEFNWKNDCLILVWTILNEMLLNKKVNCYELFTSEKTKKVILELIEKNFFRYYSDLDEFKHELDYLENLLTLNESAEKEFRNENQWETLFFTNFFLKSKENNWSKEIREMIDDYLIKSFKKFNPVFIFTSLKTNQKKIFYSEDSEILISHSVIYLWLLIRLHNYCDINMWKDFLEILYYKLRDNNDQDPILQLLYLILYLGFDSENLPNLLIKGYSMEVMNILEIFFFLMNSLTNGQYDSTKYIYKCIFPGLIIYINDLIELNCHETALEYVNVITQSNKIFGGLEKNPCFMSFLRDVKEKLINNIERVCQFKNISVSIESSLIENSNKIIKSVKSEKQIEEKNNNKKNLTKNLFDYFNSALEIIKNPLNEMKKNISINNNNNNNIQIEPKTNKDFYYDNDLKTWIINGQIANNEDEKEKEEKNNNNIEFVEPPPIAIYKKEITEKIEKNEKIENNKNNSLVFNNPFGENKDNQIKEKNNSKKILQNRYVHYK